MHEMIRRTFFFFSIIICTLCIPVQAQSGRVEKPPMRPPGDTTGTIRPDSLRRANRDTVHVKDSVVVRFIPGIGKLTTATDTENVLYKNRLLWTDAKTLQDVFWKLPGFFYRGLGEAGKYGQLNAYGTDDRRISVLLDGRPMNDPITGRYNYNDMPLEFLDEVEILSASENGLSSNDVAVNFVSRSYNSVRPFTKIRYVQDPSEDLLTDFLFTQNIARGLNLMAAFDRTVTNGNYYNSTLDAWNVRTRLRYNFSSRLNVSISDFYTKAQNGLDEGVILDDYAFIPSGASVNNLKAFDIRERHDVTFAAVARLLPDSVSTTKLNVFYTKTDREYRDPLSAEDTRQENSAGMEGFDLHQDMRLLFMHMNFGYQWQKTSVDVSAQLPFLEQEQSAVSLQVSADSLPVFHPEFVFRRERVGGEDASMLGFGLTVAPSDWVSLYAKSSWYDRFPSIQEQYWTDSLLLRPAALKKERHAFLRSGLLFRPSGTFSIALEVFHRTITDAILYQSSLTSSGTEALRVMNAGTIDVRGLTGSLRWKFRGFEANGVMTLTKYKESDTVKTLMPDIILSGELSYQDLFFKRALNARFGVRSIFYNRQQSEQLNPELMVYSESQSFVLGRSTTVDLFAILKIGDAHLSLTWANILGAHYLLSPIYPMPDRHFQIGVHWNFLD
jgi:outer membrane cobalamin receptor